MNFFVRFKEELKDLNMSKKAVFLDKAIFLQPQNEVITPIKALFFLCKYRAG